MGKHAYLRLLFALFVWTLFYSINSTNKLSQIIDRTAEYDTVPNELLQDPIHMSHQLNSANNYTELCRDCRFSGKMSCIERVEFLMNRYKQSEDESISAVMNEYPENCRIVRYNTTDTLLRSLQEEALIRDTSMMNYVPALYEINRASHLYSNLNLSIYFYDEIYDMFANTTDEMRNKYAKGTTNNNWMADIAIIDLFRTYSGRTHDPESSQIFVVPYPAASHCLHQAHITQWKNQCLHVDKDVIEKDVLGHLPYFKGKEKRHLFINTMDYWLIHPSIRDVPLSLNLGPRPNTDISKHVVVPYLNDKQSFQPSAINKHSLEWWTRPRKLSLAYFFGAINLRMGNSARIRRLNFLEEVRTNWTSSPLLGNLPYVVSSLQKNTSFPSGYLEKVYRNSVFCPCLPGDAPPQKRFFDVIMMGCIPVVLSFETQDQKISWHSKDGASIEDSYPWIQGSGDIDPAEEIDYKSFVVEVAGGVSNIKPVLERLLANSKEIRRRQINMMKVASSLSYGMGEDAHMYPDAFQMILKSLHHYIQSNP